jgi:hypothetical protein
MKSYCTCTNNEAVAFLENQGNPRPNNLFIVPLNAEFHKAHKHEIASYTTYRSLSEYCTQTRHYVEAYPLMKDLSRKDKISSLYTFTINQFRAESDQWPNSRWPRPSNSFFLLICCLYKYDLLPFLFKGIFSRDIARGIDGESITRRKASRSF